MALRVRVPCTRILSVEMIEQRLSGDFAWMPLGVCSVYVLRLLDPIPHGLRLLLSSMPEQGPGGVHNILRQFGFGVYWHIGCSAFRLNASAKICIHIVTREIVARALV